MPPVEAHKAWYVYKPKSLFRAALLCISAEYPIEYHIHTGTQSSYYNAEEAQLWARRKHMNLLRRQSIIDGLTRYQ